MFVWWRDPDIWWWYYYCKLAQCSNLLFTLDLFNELIDLVHKTFLNDSFMHRNNLVFILMIFIFELTIPLRNVFWICGWSWVDLVLSEVSHTRGYMYQHVQHGVNAPVTIALPLQVYFLLTLTMQMSTPLNRT